MHLPPTSFMQRVFYPPQFENSIESSFFESLVKFIACANETSDSCPGSIVLPTIEPMVLVEKVMRYTAPKASHTKGVCPHDYREIYLRPLFPFKWPIAIRKVPFPNSSLSQRSDHDC